MEVTLDMEFTEKYNDPESTEYKELKSNLTRAYENVEGFIDLRILFIKEGSVICSYIVILAKNSQVEKDKLTEALENAFAGKVKSIKVEEEPTYGEKLPKWALITMIVLGSLAFVFLVTVIYVCVSDR